MKKIIFGFIPFLFLTVLNSCKKETPITEEHVYHGNINFSFSHNVNGLPLIVDTLLYTNAAGNLYLINEAQYFVSDIVLHNSNGTFVSFVAPNDIHYVDTDLPSTQHWSLPDSVPVGTYTAISFTFGINEIKNQSNAFLNPPESAMYWPEPLGGGYHYMKLNGKWLDTLSNVTSFGFHLGIGQIYAHDVINTDSITGFVQNYFEVIVPNSSFEISKNKTTSIEFVMNIDSWFDSPHVWNFDYWGGSIMQNQTAMHTVAENGADAFTIGSIQ
ncbi:MAG: MbnP family protein [Bacteroidota bacterium]